MDIRLKSGIGIVIGIAVTTGCAIWLTRISQIDPFASLRGTSKMGLDFPIRISDAKMKSWNGNKLVSSAEIGAMDVRSDLRFLKFANVTKGEYRSGKLYFSYKAQQGNVDLDSQTCEAIGPVEVKGKQFDLVSRSFSYSMVQKKLSVPGQTEGDLDGGYLKATQVVYSLKSGDMTTGPILWDGNIHLKSGLQGMMAQVAGNQSSKPHKWAFNAPGGMRQFTQGKDEVQVYKDCTANDGDVIVESPRVTFNKTTDVVVCEGPVKYFSPKVNMTCDQATIYRKIKKAVLTGHVVMYVKPKDQETVDPNMVMPPFDPEAPNSVSQSAPPSPMVESAVPGIGIVPESSHAATGLNKKSGVKASHSPINGGNNQSKPLKGHLPKGDQGFRPISGTPSANTSESPEQRKKLDDELRSTKSVRKYPAVIRAQTIIYYYQKGSRHADIQGSPQAQQELPGGRWRRVWAQKAYYDGEANTLKLMGSLKDAPVLLKDSVGDKIATDWMLLSTKEGDDDFSAGTSAGYIYNENEEMNRATLKADQKDKISPKSGSKSPPKKSGTSAPKSP